jgi:hypothetical protein
MLFKGKKGNKTKKTNKRNLETLRVTGVFIFIFIFSCDFFGDSFVLSFFSWV